MGGLRHVPVPLELPWETIKVPLTVHQLIGTVICPAGAGTQKLGYLPAIVRQCLSVPGGSGKLASPSMLGLPESGRYLQGLGLACEGCQVPAS